MKLNYSISGSADAPNIVFLHGFMGSLHDWREIIGRLQPSFRCLAVDLPGHGKSLQPRNAESYTIQNTAGALIELLNKLRVTNCYLVGYSMGGRLALYLCLNFPEYFSACILESASPGLKSVAERAVRRRKDEDLANRLMSSDLKQFLTEWYRQPIFAGLSQTAQFRDMFRRRLKNSPEQLARSLREMGTGCQPSLWENISANKIPLLLVTGEFDVKFDRIAEKMARGCTGARHIAVKNCGHNIHLGNPEAFGKIVGEFFTGLS